MKKRKKIRRRIVLDEELFVADWDQIKADLMARGIMELWVDEHGTWVFYANNELELMDENWTDGCAECGAWADEIDAMLYDYAADEGAMFAFSKLKFVRDKGYLCHYCCQKGR